MSNARHSSATTEESKAQACQQQTHVSVSIFGQFVAAFCRARSRPEASPGARGNSKELDLAVDTAPVMNDGADTCAHSVWRNEDRDTYIEFLIDWLIGQKLTGTHDRETIESFARRFDGFARTAPVNTDTLFKGLKAIGIAGRLVDLSPQDPRYLAAKQRGVVRPRVRIYCLPDEVPELKTSPSMRDHSSAA